jgi:hypothetical protein
MVNKRMYHRKNQGGFLIPLLAAGIPAIVSTIAAALDVAHKAKQLKGSGMRHMYRRKHAGAGKRRYHRRGRGVVSDIVGSLPLIGPLLGPLASRIGLGRGEGLSVMRPYSLNSTAGGYHGGRLAPAGYHMMRHGRGLLAPAGSGVKRHIRKGHYRYVKKSGSGVKRVHVRAHRVGGYIPYA